QHAANSPCPATEPSKQSDSFDQLLKTWPPNCEHVRFSVIPGGFRAAGRDIGMADVMDALTFLAGQDGENRIFVDQTGLSGNFDFVMDFADAPKRSVGGDGGQTSVENHLPLLGDAIRDELGLKLIKETMPTDCFVVVQIERPTAN
ncbi:MAG TPA: TIGR03435 family protein, partial [Terriglobus sp.]